jgi:hypothetical protein
VSAKPGFDFSKPRNAELVGGPEGLRKEIFLQKGLLDSFNIGSRW